MPKKKEQTTVPGTTIGLLPGLAPLLVPVGKVQPDEQNPRQLRSLDALAASLREFGLRKPIVVNSRDSRIEAGHQTFAALLAAGAEQVPVLWADDERVDALRYNVADNRTAEIVAAWDEDKLLAILDELHVEDALLGTGFDDALFEELRLAAAQTLLDAAPAHNRQHEAPDARPVPQLPEKEKDGCWFYVEYYGQPEKFEALKKLLAPEMRTEHEVNGAFFEDLVRGALCR